MDRILVVDDENINLMMVTTILGNEYEVITAHSGEEAISYLDNPDFLEVSLILLDIHMAGMNGYETLEQIRQREKYVKIPIIFLTADDDVKAEIHGFELGADDFIKKPFVSAVVRRRVERSIDSFHLHCNLQNEVCRQTARAERRRQEIEALSMEIIQTLAAAIDAKDEYTKGHSARVAEYSAILAKKMGWDENRIEKLRYKALLHDVGKIGVPDRILNKDSRLSDEEFEIIKSHTVIGADILKGVSHLDNMELVAKHHHERYDGKGYPERIQGEEIPEEARIVCIADAYDAMSSDRVYRKALSKEIIRQELIKGCGTQFDPDMLPVFLELFDHNQITLSDKKNEELPVENSLESRISQFVSQMNWNEVMNLSGNQIDEIIHLIKNKFFADSACYLIISLTGEKQLADEELSQSMKAMDYSIEQSLRITDIVVKISKNQYLLIFREEYREQLKSVVERIFSGFYRNCHHMEIKPVYEIR